MGERRECLYPAKITLSSKIRGVDGIADGDNNTEGLDEITIETTVQGWELYIEGCRTMPNGDPGYPPDIECEHIVDEKALEAMFPNHKVYLDVDFSEPVFI